MSNEPLHIQLPDGGLVIVDGGNVSDHNGNPIDRSTLDSLLRDATEMTLADPDEFRLTQERIQQLDEKLRVSLRRRHASNEPDLQQLGRERAVSRCRSVFNLGKRLLPSDVRDDVTDEWIDEIETAAEAGKPVLWRTISILAYAFPCAVIRSLRPSRARERKG